MQTTENIMTSIENKVINNEPISPAYYVEAAIRINALVGDLDNDIAKYEAALIHLEGMYIEQDFPAAKAKILAKHKLDGYEKYLQAKSKKERIEQFIMLAKKRAFIQDI